MKFGVQIENHLGFSYDAVLTVALEAEKLGFDGLFICDHLMGRTEEVAREPCLDTWVTLGAVAAATRKIRLGPMVTPVGFRYPSVLAKMGSTLDSISGGRLQLSMGAGWYEPEFVAYGIPFPSTRQRMQQLREAVQIIRMMWTQDKPTFNGKSYNMKEAWCYPKPVQKPKIWVGGIGERRLLPIVAELADGWNATGTTPEEYETKLKVLGSYCRDRGRSLDEIERSYYASGLTGPDEKEFSASFDRYYAQFRKQGETTEGFAKRVRESGRSFIGTVDEVIAKIDKFSKLGVKYLIFYFPDKDQVGLMRQFAQHVLPTFQDS